MTHTHHPGLTLSFRLKWGREHYAEVFIWQDPQTFRATVPGMRPDSIGHACLGIHAICFPGGKRQFAYKIGEIHLVHDKYGAGIVAHEIMHLLNYWVAAKGWDWEKHDERIAKLCGHIHRDFWINFYKYFELLKKEQ
jgi:hypothetical protein